MIAGVHYNPANLRPQWSNIGILGCTYPNYPLCPEQVTGRFMCPASGSTFGDKLEVGVGTRYVDECHIPLSDK